jgi:hypothetical protein
MMAHRVHPEKEQGRRNLHYGKGVPRDDEDAEDVRGSDT